MSSAQHRVTFLAPAFGKEQVVPASKFASKFSIVITCHNQAQLIRETVESALRQQHANKEMIVVDDASTDGSAQLLRAFGDQIRVLTLEKNHGMTAARNAGAALATGDFLVFLDGDDVLKPWALPVYNRIVQAYDPKLILAGLTWFMGETPHAEAEAPAQIRLVCYENIVDKDRTFRCSGSAIVAHRMTFISAGGFTHGVLWMPEQDLLAKLAFCGRAIQIIEPCTVFYRLHTSNTIHDIPKMIQGSYQLLAAAQARMQRSSLASRIRCYPLIGGPAFYGVLRAFRAGLYKEASKLFFKAWPEVTVAAMARVGSAIFGTRPIETLPMRQAQRSAAA
jgi:glycosyltransferase involved in cell wall biosynthesis